MHALNKQELNDTILDGKGIMSDAFIPPGTSYYPELDRAITKYPFDVRRSEQLMSDAGFRKGPDGIYVGGADGRFSAELRVNPSGDTEREMASLASGWRQTGFDIQELLASRPQSQDSEFRATFPGMYHYASFLGERGDIDQHLHR